MTQLKDLKARTIYVKFDLGDTVYLKLAKEREPGMMTGWQIGPYGVMYEVSWPCTRVSRHWDMELTNTFIPDYAEDNSDD